MIAAYARGGDTHGDAIVAARAAYIWAGTGTLDDIRVAAQAVVDAYTLGDADAVTFMQGTPTYNETTEQWEFLGGNQGFWDVDLWIGGLAERPLFDGPLGTLSATSCSTSRSASRTATASITSSGRRWVRLSRSGHQQPFRRHGGARHGAQHLGGDIFITPDCVFELDGTGPLGDGLTMLTPTALSTTSSTHQPTALPMSMQRGPRSGAHLIIAATQAMTTSRVAWAMTPSMVTTATTPSRAARATTTSTAAPAMTS